MTEHPSLFADIEKDINRVHELLREMEEYFENGTDIDPDTKTELREILLILYPRVVAALERYGHSDRASELQSDWEAHPLEKRFVPQYHPIDVGGFVDCYAYNALRNAISILKDAFEHTQAEHERAQKDKAEEAKRQEVRDAVLHDRMLKIREFEAGEGDKARKWQFWLALITAGTGIAVGLGGNADKLAKLVGRSPPLAQTVVLEGTIAALDDSPSPIDLEIDCVPHVVGVVTAVGDRKWSLTIPPSVARPLKFYCRATSKTMISDLVSVSVPAGPVDKPEALPQIQPGRRPQAATNPTVVPSAGPTVAPSATGSPSL